MELHTRSLPVPLLLLISLSLCSCQLNVSNNFRNMKVRLASTNATATANQPLREGRVEVSFDNGVKWGTICSTKWTKREGNVVCRQLGLGYASMAMPSTKHGNSRTHPWGMVGTLCRGTELKLSECHRESTYPTVCDATNRNVSTVACVSKSPDLELGLVDIEVSAYLANVPMTELTCAMEENCVSKDAYVVRRTNPRGIRKLLRFSVKASNVGNADVSPYANYKDWEWHQCHMHYHSMNVFATFDVYNQRYQKVAQGHKASFCLMDSQCNLGVRRKYTCGNTTQGISAGCADVYSHVLDCQWVDVTTVPVNNRYILRVALNPEYMLGERSFENNGAECDLYYTGEVISTRVTNCKRKPLLI
ncbi:protein-lysine 6-oxidase [Drosophila novamexicana]|uniref:protein-lysine 6-oxidase n=1 Tax=Drosophila novamexicana TaxID=47314 RepID=UPI0011E5B944|nr:protein-lysine 6-oxidase [Drosophila novamexicana]